MQCTAEIDKCVWACEHFAAQAERLLEPVTVETDAALSRVVFRPLGTVLAIMPWNLPFWQLVRFAAPALMTGNVAVLRHASNVTGCALAIERLFRDAGAPLFTVLADKDQVTRIIADPRISAVTLTGSVSAGRAIKKTALELGGSDAYVVLEDADLELAVER